MELAHRMEQAHRSSLPSMSVYYPLFEPIRAIQEYSVSFPRRSDGWALLRIDANGPLLPDRSRLSPSTWSVGFADTWWTEYVFPSCDHLLCGCCIWRLSDRLLSVRSPSVRPPVITVACSAEIKRASGIFEETMLVCCNEDQCRKVVTVKAPI